MCVVGRRLGWGEQGIKEGIKVRPPSQFDARDLVKVLVAYVGDGAEEGEGEANSCRC